MPLIAVFSIMLLHLLVVCIFREWSDYVGPLPFTRKTNQPLIDGDL